MLYLLLWQQMDKNTECPLYYHFPLGGIQWIIKYPVLLNTNVSIFSVFNIRHLRYLSYEFRLKMPQNFCVCVGTSTMTMKENANESNGHLFRRLRSGCRVYLFTKVILKLLVLEKIETFVYVSYKQKMMLDMFNSTHTDFALEHPYTSIKNTQLV